MNKYIIYILIIICSLNGMNLYGQAIDTIPPEFHIYFDALNDVFPYDEYYDADKNLLFINAGWCDDFPEDFMNIGIEYYFYITDNSDSIIVTYVDSLDYDLEYLTRVYEARDTSGNISNLEVRVTRSSTTGTISYLNLVINNPDKEIFFEPFVFKEDTVYLCDDTDVKIDAIVGFVCSGRDARFEWRIDDEPVFVDSTSSITFNLDTMNRETTVSITVSESGSIDGQFKIIKKENLSAKIIEQPSCNLSDDGSIQLDSVTDVTWEYDTSIDNYFLENLGPGLYPVSYESNGCYYNDTITLVPENILDFTVSDTIINQNGFLTITNTSNLSGDYFWQIGDSTFSNNSSEFVFDAFNFTGDYDIKLTNSSGTCSNTIKKSIVVTPITSVYSNILSPINIGPNPFSDVLNIELNGSKDYRLTIYGIDGKIFYKNHFYGSRTIELDLSFLYSGIYILDITSPEGSDFVKGHKILKL